MRTAILITALLCTGCEDKRKPEPVQPLGFVHADSACVGKIKPRNPQNSPLYQYQDPVDDSKWHFYVEGYVQASEAEGCWKLGLVPLDYRDPEQRAPDLPNEQDPQYWPQRPDEKP